VWSVVVVISPVVWEYRIDRLSIVSSASHQCTRQFHIAQSIARSGHGCLVPERRLRPDKV